MIVRVSVAFTRLQDAEIRGFVGRVIEGMTANPAFPSPPVTMAALEAAADDFSDKLAGAKMGGPMDTAAKNNSRDSLMVLLRRIAVYVQLHCNNDLTTLLGSGFQAASTNRSQTPLERPVGLTVKNGNSGQLVASVRPIKNKGMYEGRIKQKDGDWLPSVFSGDSRRVTFNGLTPGTMYTIQVRALGGATGQSEWSDPSSHMSL